MKGSKTDTQGKYEMVYRLDTKEMPQLKFIVSLVVGHSQHFTFLENKNGRVISIMHLCYGKLVHPVKSLFR